MTPMIRWKRATDTVLIALAFGVAIALTLGIGHHFKGDYHASHYKARPGDPS